MLLSFGNNIVLVSIFIFYSKGISSMKRKTEKLIYSFCFDRIKIGIKIGREKDKNAIPDLVVEISEEVDCMCN